MKAVLNRDELRLQLNWRRPGFTLDFDVGLPGRGITALFGASGCGKTTCLRVLAGLEPGAKGHVSVLGEVWQDSAKGVFWPVHRRALGYVFQEASLFDHLNVRDNLLFGYTRTPRAQRKRGWDTAVELLGIGHLLLRWPHELSGGERQRVAIARTLATSPKLLLMDEPLAALDTPRKAELLPYLAGLPAELGIPMVYVSHAIDEVARLADHMVLMSDGRVSASGATDEILTRLELPLAHGDTAGAVLTVKVSAHDQLDHLTSTHFDGGQLTVPMQEVPIGQSLRVRIQARDVSLTLEQHTGSSILNRLRVTVMALSPDGPGQIMVALDAGGSTVLARITARSARLLDLAPGQALFAQVKGVAILG